MDKDKEEFEAWYVIARSGPDTKVVDDLKLGSDGEYYYQETFWMLKAWQASRATMVIELPDWFDPYGGSGEQAYWRIEVEKAIEAAGLTVAT